MHHSGVTQSRHWVLHVVLVVTVRGGLAGVVVAFPNFGVKNFVSRLQGWSLSSWSYEESIVTGGEKEERRRSKDARGGPPTTWVPSFSPTHANTFRTVADNEETWPTSRRSGEGPHCDC